jgi:O-antigen/teichoic acid export membrane protein
LKLIKTSIYSAVITLVRLSSGFIVSKIIAIFTGPAGVALIGAFANFISITLTFANGAINTGVIKYTSENKEDTEKLKILFSTSLRISIICSLVFSLPLILFSTFLSKTLLTTDIYSGSITVLGFTIVLYSVNSLLISILNGKEQIKTYTLVNTAGSVVGLLFTIFLVFFYKIEGALYAMVLSQSIVFFVTLTLVIRSSWFSWSYFSQAFDKLIAIKLSQYSLMAVITALTVPVSQIILRNYIIKKIGLSEAGYWQGMMRVSDGYLMLITTALSTYYLPKLSSLKTKTEIRNEVLNGYKLILPTVLIGCFIIYFLRIPIIHILYTDTFLEMEGLFLWQLIGDFFKLSAWILAYLMLAKAMTKTYIVTEVLFSLSYICLSCFFVDKFGLKGITIAYSLNFLIYLLTMLWIFRVLLFKKQ